MKIKFIKCHGAENDFVLIDAITNKYSFKENKIFELVQKFCDRKGIIGANGVLLLLNSYKADAKMRIFNADGSEAEMCGNGIRCIGRRTCEIFNKDSVSIETMKGTFEVKNKKDIFKNVKSFSVNITNVSFELKDLPLLLYERKNLINYQIRELLNNLKFTAISIGNPHIIANVDLINSELLKNIGRKANKIRNIFPNGINVSFYKILDNQTIFVETYERGVGLTYSCGTAMAASSIVSCILGDNILNRWINVYNKGGIVKCKPNYKEKKYSVQLLGNASFIYKSSVEINLNNINNNQIHKVDYNDEIKAYSKLKCNCKKFVNKYNPQL